MAVEIALRVTSNPAAFGYKDGMPAGIKPAGIHWTLAEVNQWVNNDIEPANFSLLNRTQKQAWRRWRRGANYVLNNPWDPVDAAQRYFSLGAGTPTQSQLDDVEAIRQDFLEAQTNIITHGFLDSQWGFLDMKMFAIMTMDVSMANLEEYMQSPIDPNVNEFAPRKRFARRSVIVDWRNLPGVGAGLIALIEDQSQILAPATFRSREYTNAEVLAVLTELEDPSQLP